MEAELPVTATIGGASPGVYFDEKEFEWRKKSVAAGLIDIDRLNDLAFGQTWLKNFPAPARNSDVEGFEGVSMLLANASSFKLVNLLSNSSLSPEASRPRARFCGELISSSIVEVDAPITGNVVGTSIKSANRLVVVPGTALLSLSWFLTACYSLAML